MNTGTYRRGGDQSAAAIVRSTIEDSKHQVWQPRDFPKLPPGAVHKALNRLAAEGTIEKICGSIYYAPGQTVLGPTIPSIRELIDAISQRQTIHPAGLFVANAFGFTTQVAARIELSTPEANIPAFIKDHFSVASVHVKRPQSRKNMSWWEGGVMELLGYSYPEWIEYEDDRIVGPLKRVFDRIDFERLSVAALGGKPIRQRHLISGFAEAPRTRAVLGAVGESIGIDERILSPIRQSLHPCSRFDFRGFAALPTSSAWQAKRS